MLTSSLTSFISVFKTLTSVFKIFTSSLTSFISVFKMLTSSLTSFISVFKTFTSSLTSLTSSLTALVSSLSSFTSAFIPAVSFLTGSSFSSNITDIADNNSTCSISLHLHCAMKSTRSYEGASLFVTNRLSQISVEYNRNFSTRFDKPL